MATATEYPHVEIDDSGKPFIRGTRFKLAQLVLDRIAYNWDADEMQRHHPMLTLAQIHSALGYYYDHQEQMDDLISRRKQQTADAVSYLNESPLRIRLHAIKSNERS